MKKNIKNIFIALLFFVSITSQVFAVDGSGTNTVSPNFTNISSTGNTHTFTYTASESMNSGGITITAPSGWSAPQGTAGAAGYTTVSSSLGTIASVLDNADATTGWSAGTACGDGLSSSATKQEGTASILCDTRNESSGDVFYKNITSSNWSSYTKVGFWIRASENISANRLQFSYDNNTNLASPIENINIAAISKNTWTYIPLTFGATTRTAVLSYGFRFSNNNTLDNGLLYIDDLLIGPGVPTFPGGGVINTRFLQLTTGQTVVVTYGATGGSSGATAPSTAGTYTFTTQSRISDAGTLTNIAVQPTIEVRSPATKFVIINPTDGTVESPIAITVQAQDSGGTVDTNYQNDVTLNVSGSATGGGLVNIINGVGTINISNTVAETVNLSLTDSQGTGLNVSSVQDVVFGGGSASQYTLNNPGDMYARTRLGYSVTRKDVYGNLVTSGASTVYLYSTSVSVSAKFYNDSLAGDVITSISIPDGQSSVNFWYYDEEAGTYTITTSDNVSAPDGTVGIDDATDSVTVLPVATKFVIINPVDSTVDNSVNITVQAQKPDNSIDTNYQSDVTLNVSGSATGGGLVDIINGVGVKTISNTVAETVNLSLTDSQGTGLNISSIQDVVFSAGATSQFVLNTPADISAGQRASYTVERKDQYGNTKTNGTNSVYLYSTSSGVNKKFYDSASGGNVITSISITDGQSTANFWYYDETPGTWDITASDNSSTPDGNININDSVDTLVVSTGATGKFLLDNPGNMTAGTKLGYTVSREDLYSNVATIGSDIVYLYTSSSGSSKAFYDAASGGNIITSIAIPNGQSSVNFWYYDEEVGTWDITVSDNGGSPDGSLGIIDATDSVVVDPAPIVATRFVIEDPTDGTVDNPIVVTVKAVDNSNNLDTTYQTDVTLNTSGSATGGGVVDITDGVGTINISDTVTENVNLTLTNSEGTTLDVSSTQNVTFSAGATSQFTLNNPGDVVAGERIGYKVTRKDQYGNLVTSGATTVYLYSLALGINDKFYDASSGGSAINFINIINGNSSSNFWYYDEYADTTTIIASDNSTTPDGATGIDDADDQILISAGPVYKFTINDPGDMTQNTRLGYTVTRKDAFDNLIASGVSLVYPYSTSNATTTKFFDSPLGGLAVSSIPINDGNSIANFWYYDETPGTWNITASDHSSTPDGSIGIIDAVDSVVVSALPIVATKFVIINPIDSLVGNSVTVTIQAQDNSGNIDTTYQSDVTLNVSGSATGGGLVDIINGIGSKAINDAVEETVILSLSDSQGTGLNISHTQDVIFSTTPVAPTGVITGGGAPIIVVGGVSFSGKAYPGAKLSILALKDQDEPIKKATVPSANGSFDIEFKGISRGARAYALTVLDKENRQAQTKVYDLNLINEQSILDVNNILVSPTLGFARPVVTKGDFLSIIGYATPGNSIEIEIDGKQIVANIIAANSGEYRYLYNTLELALGPHTIKTRQVTSNGIRSEYSPQKVFFTTDLYVPKTDFNNDGRVNISDWSVFLSRWASKDENMKKLNDLNGDGKMDVSDFSIFVRTIKF